MSPPTSKRKERPESASDRFVIGVIRLFTLLAVPAMLWIAFYLSADTYGFWKHGIEKWAFVVALTDSNYVYRGGTSYQYKIRVDDHEFLHNFRCRLPVGGTVSVLEMPGAYEEITLGHKGSSLLSIFYYSAGGYVRGTEALVGLLSFVLAPIGILYDLWKKRLKHSADLG